MANLYVAGVGTRDIQPENGTHFLFAELYPVLGCTMIQVLPLRQSQRLMLIDEEGKLHEPGKPYNHAATVIAKFEESIMDSDYIVGDAIICRPDELR